MIEQILFIVSATASIFYFVKVLSICMGNSMGVPIPLLHYFGAGFENTYIYTPSIAYQVYFWSNYAGIFNV